MTDDITPGMSKWARDTIDEIHRRLDAEDLMRCPHITNRPSQMHAASLRWGRISCEDCAETMFSDLAEVGAVCDRCGRGLAGRGGDLVQAVDQTNNVRLAYALCDDCSALDV
jgi:hypothetical protein